MGGTASTESRASACKSGSVSTSTATEKLGHGDFCHCDVCQQVGTRSLRGKLTLSDGLQEKILGRPEIHMEYLVLNHMEYLVLNHMEWLERFFPIVHRIIFSHTFGV